jgi:hypothetical protein
MFFDRTIVFDTKTPSDFKSTQTDIALAPLGYRPPGPNTRVSPGTRTIHAQVPGGLSFCHCGMRFLFLP